MSSERCEGNVLVTASVLLHHLYTILLCQPFDLEYMACDDLLSTLGAGVDMAKGLELMS